MLDVNGMYRTLELAPDIKYITEDNFFNVWYKNQIENLVIKKILPDYYTNLCEQFEKWVVTEVVPRIDQNYRTDKTAKGRAIMGSSFGGNKASAFIYRYASVFGNLIAQSGFYTKYFENTAKRYNVKAWLSYGIYDIDWVRGIVGEYYKNTEDLDSHFTDYRVHIYNGGHKPWTWIIDFEDAVRFLF